MLHENTEVRVYQARVLSIYGIEMWTTSAKQEQCLRRILDITWQEYTQNNDVLDYADMFALQSQRCLRWFGRVCHMEDERIPKDILCGELTSGAVCVSRPALQFRDACKRDKICSDRHPVLGI